jgi:UDP-N-acetylmuramate-alanine ligase
MFLGLNPLIAVVTNWNMTTRIVTRLLRSTSRRSRISSVIEASGMVILCADKPGAMSIRERLSPNLPVFTYSAYLLQSDKPNSSQQNADYLLTESSDHTTLLCSQEALHVRQPLLSMKVGVPGTHNLQNGMAAAIAALNAGVEPKKSNGSGIVQWNRPPL